MLIGSPDVREAATYPSSALQSAADSPPARKGESPTYPHSGAFVADLQRLRGWFAARPGKTAGVDGAVLHHEVAMKLRRACNLRV